MSLLTGFLRDALLPPSVMQQDVYIAIRTDAASNASQPVGSGTAEDPDGGAAGNPLWLDALLADEIEFQPARPSASDRTLSIRKGIQEATRNGLRFEGCDDLNAEENLIDNAPAKKAVTFANCPSAKFFNNQNTAGALLRAHDGSRYKLELADEVQDVLLASGSSKWRL